MHVEKAAFETRQQWRTYERTAVAGEHIGMQSSNVVGMPWRVDVSLGDEYRHAAIRRERHERSEEIPFGLFARGEMASPRGISATVHGLDEAQNALFGSLAVAAD